MNMLVRNKSLEFPLIEKADLNKLQLKIISPYLYFI